MKKVKTIEENILGILPLGTMVKNPSYGRGIIVGYSSISGNPVVFFYTDEITRCIDVNELTNEVKDKVNCTQKEQKDLILSKIALTISIIAFIVILLTVIN